MYDHEKSEEDLRDVLQKTAVEIEHLKAEYVE